LDNDSQDAVLQLGNATVVLPPAGGPRRFRVDAAILTPRGRRRVRLAFEGPQGSVTIEMPRVTFWMLTSLFHERSIVADAPDAKRPEPQKLRKRP
jgi:hypothetical protein